MVFYFNFLFKSSKQFYGVTVGKERVDRQISHPLTAKTETDPYIVTVCLLKSFLHEDLVTTRHSSSEIKQIKEEPVLVGRRVHTRQIR